MLWRQLTLWFLALVMAAGYALGVLQWSDPEDAYFARIEQIPIFENTLEDAVPQTMVYDLMMAHLQSPLPEGKTEKKILVIGYDGCRADLMSLLDRSKKSSVKTLLGLDGKAYYAYCGGVNYPAPNTQKTSTAPGWCTELTGVWADVHGVTKNKLPKSNDTLTILTTAVRDGLADSAAFYVSWDKHFKDENSTYIHELEYIRENNINTNFCDALCDVGTYYNVARDLKRQDCSDIIFSIFEFCDQTGHLSGFALENPAYRRAFFSADRTGAELLDLVQARENYATEDWLLIITADHGGIGDDHGKASVQERMIFIITNKPLPEDTP